MDNPQPQIAHKHLSPAIWFSVILILAFAVGYMAWAKSSSAWPFDGTIFPYPEHKKAAQDDEANDWKTYHNEEFGFEVKYPKDQTFDDSCSGEDSLLIGFDGRILCDTDAPHEASIILSVSKNDPNRFESTISSIESTLTGQVKKEQIVDGIEGTRIEGTIKNVGGPSYPSGIKEYRVLVEKDDTTVDFSHYVKSGETYSNLFDQIISTFKFTN